MHIADVRVGQHQLGVQVDENGSSLYCDDWKLPRSRRVQLMAHPGADRAAAFRFSDRSVTVCATDGLALDGPLVEMHGFTDRRILTFAFGYQVAVRMAHRKPTTRCSPTSTGGTTPN